MAGKKLHSLPIFSFVLQPRVLVLWIVASMLTFWMLSLSRDGISVIIAGSIYLIFAATFLNFGMDLVESTARGNVEAPSYWASLTGASTRLSHQLLCVAFAVTAVSLAPSIIQWLVVSVLMAIAPAVTSSIAFNIPLHMSIDPRRIYRFMSNMGYTYLALRVVMTSGLLVCLFVASGELELLSTTFGKLIVAFGTMLLLILMFRSTGALLHVQRDKMGIVTDFSEEQAQQEVEHNYRDAAIELLKQARLVQKLDSTKAAWKMIEDDLKKHAYRDDQIYLALLRELTNRQLLYRHASGLVDRALPREVTHAWAILVEMDTESQSRFLLRNGSTLLKLVGTAQNRQERLLLLRLLERFDQDFPTHPKLRQAMLFASELSLLLDDDDRARQNLVRVQTLSGEIDEHLFARCQQQLGEA
jgi:hypothetical protein